MPRANLIRVGDTVINLDNVMLIDLNHHHDDGEPEVVVEFVMRGMDELDEGANFTNPYLHFFNGEEAAAVRRFFEHQCPDLLAAPPPD